MRKVASTVGAAALVAAGLMSSPAIAGAEPEGQDGRVVRYTVTTGQEATVGLYYLATEPDSQASYDADPNAYLRNERVTIVPGAPWVFETTLNDTSWAYVSAGAAARYTGSATPRCEIAIDGEVVVEQAGDTSALCALKPW
ncbi:hypothetical protein [Mycolicibacterium thermoresistibile]|uniref:Secreted protein n=2 Tax=Mycolicibacterium thermoresistibile TaxID=1797 RepID=G7CG78_MYCT3|nr:hypothetical protein [Mycolicibacterium thermoresistibile]EHI13507.1 hypothetical protein KEK_10022 [Mycolicibacterium thermoresistibile ATCC 19527]MCV7188728.1 hypothetical protein [Mycolicibacterium thermoresistibile]GAT16743.1 putative uncharacterized protein [Mycolicibacterium thermoresistibile]SNW18803.1 Conserved membrane protein of uncharacterised function [Mycolicibacterium thermoresistibile]